VDQGGFTGKAFKPRRVLQLGEQSQRLGLSQKTLYAQRLAGVKKLVEYHPHLAPLQQGEERFELGMT
jgi:hypothetical protein